MARNIDILLDHTPDHYKDAPLTNYEQFPAFERPLPELYVQMLLTNTLGGTFYASSNELVEGTVALHRTMAVQDAKFVAKAAVYARNEGFMRLQPILALCALLGTGHTQHFALAFDKVIRTPGDLSDFVELARGGAVGATFGRAAKTAVAGWLENMSEYHAIKYAAGGQGYSLLDMMRLTHPVAPMQPHKTVLAWLAGKAESLKAAPQLKAYVDFMNADSDAARRKLIRLGKLPHEVVTGRGDMSLKMWRELVLTMPTFALLRNLNTMQRHDVFAGPEGAAWAQTVANRLTMSGVIRRANILPFRLFSAYKAFNPKIAADDLIVDALAEALEASFVNMPRIEGRLMTAIDVSGSMGGQVSERSSVRYQDIAGIFAAAMIKRNPGMLFMGFDTELYTLKFFGVTRQDSLLTIARAVGQDMGGTNLDLPIDWLKDNKEAVDVFVGITDDEEWAGRGFLNAWIEYRKAVAPQAKAYLIRIDPYRHAVADAGLALEHNINFVYGFNDSVLKFIQATEGPSQVSAIEAHNLREM